MSQNVTSLTLVFSLLHSSPNEIESCLFFLFLLGHRQALSLQASRPVLAVSRCRQVFMPDPREKVCLMIEIVTGRNFGSEQT